MNAVGRISGQAADFRRLVHRWMFLLVAAVPLQASAQPERLHDVKAWRGTFTASASGHTTEQLQGYEGRNASTMSVSYNGEISVSFLLDQFEDEPAVWRGRVLSSNLNAIYRSEGEGLGKDGSIVKLDFHTGGPLDFDPDDRAELQFHRERGWSFHIGGGWRKVELSQAITLKRTGQVFRETREISAYGLRDTPTLPYPEKGLILSATGKTEPLDRIATSVGMFLVWDYRVNLEPASLEELKLEIDEPEDYATWRPETTPGRDPGKALEVTARVISSTGGKPNTRVESFHWELQSTSREPGVTLNFPVDAADDRLDLELDATGEFFVLSQDKQKMDRAVRDGWSDTVKIVPYDWGGWSTLQVTAVLADGRRVTGKLKGKSEPGLRVPKRAFDSHIADGWKQKTGARGADVSDDDNIPVGDGTKGDGLSLYEEYRGFYEQGEHLEGEPKTKDFFIRIDDAWIALSGIAKFQRLTKLKVHHGFTEHELPPSRVINANHARGAHVTSQHGVIVRINGQQEGFAEARGGPGTPKMISSVELMSDFAALRSDKRAKIVAHELGHCVNIYHHGETDWKVVWGEADGKLMEFSSGNAAGVEISVWNEGKRDLTPTFVAHLRKPESKLLTDWMGRDQGQHSGADNCLMRYYVSRVYASRTRPALRFADFDEPIGDSTLCTVASGSGVNQESHSPQSRYGPAHAGRGNCSHQILVTDAVTAPSRVKPPAQP